MLQHLPVGVEARLGRARQAGHRCTSSASVVASFTDARARHDMRPSLTRPRPSWLHGETMRQRECRRRRGLLQLVPSGVEAHLGRARHACYRCTASASVVASFTDARARLDMPPLTAARCTCHWVSGCCYDTRADVDTACCSTCQLAWRRIWAVLGTPAIGARPPQAWWLRSPTHVHASTCHR